MTRAPRGGDRPPERQADFLTIEEAAAYLRIGVDWLRNSDCARIRLGTRVVFYREDLRQFALARRTLVPETRLRVVPRVAG